MHANQDPISKNKAQKKPEKSPHPPNSIVDETQQTWSSCSLRHVSGHTDKERGGDRQTIIQARLNPFFFFFFFFFFVLLSPCPYLSTHIHPRIIICRKVAGEKKSQMNFSRRVFRKWQQQKNNPPKEEKKQQQQQQQKKEDMRTTRSKESSHPPIRGGERTTTTRSMHSCI